MLKLVLGGSGSGKTTLLYYRIKARAEQGRRSILLVPEQFTSSTEGRIYRELGDALSGMVDSNGVHFLRPQKIDTPYQLRPEVDSRVFLLKLFPGTQPDVLDFIAQAGYRGLVIEAFGLGGLHYIRRNLVEKLRMLRQRGVRILVLTQCMYEKADLSIYEVGTQLLRTDVLSGMDLTTEAAVTKLMWALAQDNTDELLTKNLCGEIRD